MTPHVLKELCDEIDVKFALLNQVKHVVEIRLYVMEIVIGVGKCPTCRDMDTMEGQGGKRFPFWLGTTVYSLLGTSIVGM
jgi:hypothetical protein